MKNFIKLKDGSQYEIKEGASIGDIDISAKDDATAAEISAKFTRDNVKTVTFSQGETAETATVTGEYTDLILEHVYRETVLAEDGKTATGVEVMASMRESTDAEKRISANEAAIDSINMQMLG